MSPSRMPTMLFFAANANTNGSCDTATQPARSGSVKGFESDNVAYNKTAKYPLRTTICPTEKPGAILCRRIGRNGRANAGDACTCAGYALFAFLEDRLLYLRRWATYPS